MMYQASETTSNEVRGPHLLSVPPIRIMLIFDCQFSCDVMNQIFSGYPQFDVVKAVSDVPFGLEYSLRLRPDVVILSGSAGCEAIEQAAEMVDNRQISNLMILDDRLHECALDRALQTPRISYFTHQTGLEELLRALHQIALHGEQVFDPQVQHRVQRTPRGFRLTCPRNCKSVALLTRREKQVMRLLAQGKSVRDCAQQLHLAESTIDNHKSRLMSKLQVHKASHLTSLAIRDGLIRV